MFWTQNLNKVNAPKCQILSWLNSLKISCFICIHRIHTEFNWPSTSLKPFENCPFYPWIFIQIKTKYDWIIKALKSKVQSKLPANLQFRSISSSEILKNETLLISYGDCYSSKIYLLYPSTIFLSTHPRLLFISYVSLHRQFQNNPFSHARNIFTSSLLSKMFPLLFVHKTRINLWLSSAVYVRT